MLTYTDKAGRDYLYVELTKEKAREFVASHILADRPVAKYILEGSK
jgi:(2Fe-2S) ferredoxin